MTEQFVGHSHGTNSPSVPIAEVLQLATRNVGTRPNVTLSFFWCRRHLANTIEWSDNFWSAISYPH